MSNIEESIHTWEDHKISCAQNNAQRMRQAKKFVEVSSHKTRETNTLNKQDLRTQNTLSYRSLPSQVPPKYEGP